MLGGVNTFEHEPERKCLPEEILVEGAKVKFII